MFTSKKKKKKVFFFKKKNVLVFNGKLFPGIWGQSTIGLGGSSPCEIGPLTYNSMSCPLRKQEKTKVEKSESTRSNNDDDN